MMRWAKYEYPSTAKDSDEQPHRRTHNRLASMCLYAAAAVDPEYEYPACLPHQLSSTSLAYGQITPLTPCTR